MPHSESQLLRRLMQTMNERAKELKCLYNVDDILKRSSSTDKMFEQLLEVIPSGWQHTTLCEARILYLGNYYLTTDFQETPWFLSADIIVDNRVCGRIDVVYLQNIHKDDRSNFLPEEKQLLNAIADRIGNYLFHLRVKQALEAGESAQENLNEVCKDEEQPDVHWRWRRKMMEEFANKLEGDKLGVKAVYLVGSSREHTAGPASDIDLIIHFKGNEKQKELLKAEAAGWSKCLSFINWEKTGYQTDNLIDLHFVTDEDISKKNSFAIMITPPLKADLLKEFK